MATIEKVTEDDRHEQSATIRTRTTLRKIAQMIQTADKIIRFSQDLMIFIKETKILKVKHKRIMVFLSAGRVVKSYMEDNTYTEGGPNQTKQSIEQIQSSSGEADPLRTK